ncbi:MAG: FlgD immunoglobulin-like domain containing protein, partial [Candidatus Cloacimonetes bacterium]|nr:FlgD immunoglobulin-like domain containing protein [Candidatus Cloacimonadota bacterium]
SGTKEYVGRNSFSVGIPLVNHHEYIPANPSYADSVAFSAKVLSSVEIASMDCYVRTDSTYVNNQPHVVWKSLPMQVSEQDSTIWQSTQKLQKYGPGKELPFKYRFTTIDGQSLETALLSLVIPGPDIFLKDMVFDVADGTPKLKVFSTNIGNMAAPQTDLRLYYKIGESNQQLASTQPFAPLELNEERWDTIYLDNVPSANLTFEARVNANRTFPEWDFFINTNNYISLTMPYNYFNVDAAGGVYNSVDNNMSCTVPASFAGSGSFLMAINTMSALPSLNQPDVEAIRLQNADAFYENQQSIPYEIKLLDASMTDSLGVFTNGMRMNLSFRYDGQDADNIAHEGENSFKIYRYNPDFQKWILIGGHVVPAGDMVSFEVTRAGIYSLFRNRDVKAPSVDVNVQDQEFTVGGYVAGNGVISLLLSDANGIDVIDNSIILFMNGVEVPQGDYVISVNKENINRIPIKYQLALGRGDHELKVDCRDLNGNFMTREVRFVVNDKFNISNIGNYPNPVLGQAQDPKNDGRTRFTYVLTDTADEVYIKVYTISGRLVKTFRNLPTGVGYHEYPRTVYAWDCKDEQGFPLANGTYFYRVVARRGDKKIEKIMKMAILR